MRPLRQRGLLLLPLVDLADDRISEGLEALPPRLWVIGMVHPFAGTCIEQIPPALRGQRHDRRHCVAPAPDVNHEAIRRVLTSHVELKRELRALVLAPAR